MSSMFYIIIVIFAVLENRKIYSYGIRNKAKRQEVPNIDLYIRPLKKLLGIFPNHEIEVQFDVAQSSVDSRETKNFYKNRALRIQNETTVTIKNTKKAATKHNKTTQRSTTTNEKGSVVYMEDLKKAFEKLEKKLNVTVNCNSVTINNGTSDAQSLDILSIIKEGAMLPKDAKKPNDDDLSWIQIRIPS